MIVLVVLILWWGVVICIPYLELLVYSVMPVTVGYRVQWPVREGNSRNGDVVDIGSLEVLEVWKEYGM